MLKIFDRQAAGSNFCDGHSRRTFLQIGALGGLTLPQLLQAEAKSGISNSHKAVIMVYMCGGPPHQDMFDLKPDAPAEVRGEFSPIKTNISGIEICEHLPKMASMMDKFVPIRTMANCQRVDTLVFNVLPATFLTMNRLVVGLISVVLFLNFRDRSMTEFPLSSVFAIQRNTNHTTNLKQDFWALDTAVSVLVVRVRMIWYSRILQQTGLTNVKHC